MVFDAMDEVGGKAAADAVAEVLGDAAGLAAVEASNLVSESRRHAKLLCPGLQAALTGIRTAISATRYSHKYCPSS